MDGQSTLLSPTDNPLAPADPADTEVFHSGSDIPEGLNAIWVREDVLSTPAIAAALIVDPDNPFAVSELVAAVPHTAEPRPTSPAVGTLPARRKSRPGRRRNMILGVSAAAIVVGGIATFMMLSRPPAPVRSVTPVASNEAPAASAVPSVYSRDLLKGNIALVDEFRPTHGRPIAMLYVPNGVNLVVHLRPADLWSADHSAAELRASLTEGVTSWLDGRIRELCRREPARVSEATLAFVLGAFGTQPTSTRVVRLTQPDKMSTLLDEFRGQPLKEDLKPAVTLSPPHAYILVDTSTFSISPAETADELQESLATPNAYVSKNVAELLKRTDRDRMITVVAELQDLRRHVDTLFAEPVRPTIQAVLDWLGDDVDAIAWSLHPQPTLHSEMTLRPRTGVSPKTLEAQLQKKLDDLPTRMMTQVKGTRPAAKGFREIIGRYPAMLEAVRQATVLRPDSKDVHAVTVLPSKAAPNLALGTLLTWDELRRTPASSQAVAAGASTTNEKVIDRLNKEILAEFNRTPLEQAVKYIGDETGVDFTVDGEALRQTGYTRNMPQTMSLGKVPGTRAIKEILSVPNQKDLALFIDEAAGKAILSTRPMLKQQGRTEFTIP